MSYASPPPGDAEGAGLIIGICLVFLAMGTVWILYSFLGGGAVIKRLRQIDIYRGQLERNRGHSLTAHKGKSFEETGFTARCYRCVLMKKIEKESLPPKQTERTWCT